MPTVSRMHAELNALVLCKTRLTSSHKEAQKACLFSFKDAEQIVIGREQQDCAGGESTEE